MHEFLFLFPTAWPRLGFFGVPPQDHVEVTRVSVGKPWSRHDEHLLRRLYPGTQTREIALKLGRSFAAVRSRAKVLHLAKIRNYHRWTPAEDRILRAKYPDTETAKLALRFDTTVLSTYRRAQKLGARKSAAYIAKKLQIEAERLTRVGVASRYQKGRTPENKGLRRPG